MLQNFLICVRELLEGWCKSHIDENQINAKMTYFLTNPIVKEMICESKALIMPA